MTDQHMTPRLRVTVRLLDVLAADLASGTEAEKGVSRLLALCAHLIVNGDAPDVLYELERHAAGRPRADLARLAAEAAAVELDGLDLPESYTGIGG